VVVHNHLSFISGHWAVIGLYLLSCSFKTVADLSIRVRFGSGLNLAFYSTGICVKIRQWFLMQREEQKWKQFQTIIKKTVWI